MSAYRTGSRTQPAFLTRSAAYLRPLPSSREEAPQRTHKLREVFDALRWIVRAGAPWCVMPNDLLRRGETQEDSKVHRAVETSDHPLAPRVTPATEQDRAQMGELVRSVQGATAGAWSSPTWTGAPLARRPAKRLVATASGWRSSSIQGSRKASCCCRAGTWWKAPSRGLRASGGWPKPRALARDGGGAALRRLRPSLPPPHHPHAMVEPTTASSKSS